jgi:hypothetical protein
MDPNDVARAIDLENLLCKGLIHLFVVVPRPLFCSPIIWCMLSIVEECVKFMLGVSSPSALVFEMQTVIFILKGLG